MNNSLSNRDSTTAKSPEAGVSFSAGTTACEEQTEAIPPNADRDQIFRLLTEEIRDRHEIGKLEGWTPWLISGALVSMAWLLVQDVWSQPLRVDSVRASFLIASITLFAVIDIRGTLTSMSEPRGSRRPFSLLHTSTTALSTAAKSLWFAGIGIACIFRPRIVEDFALWTLGIAFLVIAGVGALMVIFIAKRLPVPITSSGILSLVIITTVFTTVGVASIASLSKSTAISGAQIADIRAGGLLALSAFAIVILCRGHSSSFASKEALVELRQEVVLGDLSSEDARQRTRVALQGMFLSDLVRDDTRALLKFISDVRGIYSEASKKIVTLKTGCPALLSSATPADFEKLAIASTLDVLETCEPKVNAISKQYFKLLNSVQLRLALVSRIMKAASSDEANVVSEVKRAQTRADTDQDRFIRDFHEIQTAWNRWYPMEARHYEPFNTPSMNESATS